MAKTRKRWMCPGWLKVHLRHLSVTKREEVSRVMNDNAITFAGENLKVELALMQRLHDAGALCDPR